MKLYHWPGSCSDRIKTILDVWDIEHEIELVNLAEGASRSREYLKVNPFGQVPALDVDGTIIAESAAICAYLATARPESGIAPQIGSPEFGRFLQWIVFCTATFWPVIGIAGGSLLLPERDGQIPPDGRVLATGLLKAIDRGREGTFQLGEQMTGADIFLRDMLKNADMLNLLGEFDDLRSYAERVDEEIARRTVV